jgi:hypothetical protein
VEGGRGEDIRKEYRRVNMVEILCTHVMYENGKMKPVETIPGTGREEG